MRLRGAALTAWLLLTALGASAGEIQVREGWVRQPPPGANAAAYMTLANGGESSRQLLGVRSDAAERVEIHRTVEEGGVARMRPVDAVPLPAGEEVVLAPRGLHLMLIRPRALEEGQEIELVLELDGDATVRVRLPVRREAASGHGAGHGHDHGH